MTDRGHLIRHNYSKPNGANGDRRNCYQPLAMVGPDKHPKGERQLEGNCESRVPPRLRRWRSNPPMTPVTAGCRGDLDTETAASSSCPRRRVFCENLCVSNVAPPWLQPSWSHSVLQAARQTETHHRWLGLTRACIG
eukprot:scaffold764_cov248-Pinguiococcus_pyrenoidosus.AAC.12